MILQLEISITSAAKHARLFGDLPEKGQTTDRERDGRVYCSAMGSIAPLKVNAGNVLSMFAQVVQN